MREVLEAVRTLPLQPTDVAADFFDAGVPAFVGDRVAARAGGAGVFERGGDLSREVVGGFGDAALAEGHDLGDRCRHDRQPGGRYSRIFSGFE